MRGELTHARLRESWWWCRRHHGWCELVDSGDAFPKCDKCKSSQVELRPAPGAHDAPAVLQVLPQWAERAALEPRTKPKGRLSRLPAEKRDLRVLARTGYWFCYECRNISELDKQEDCVLCGRPMDRATNWNEPVLCDEPTNTEGH